MISAIDAKELARLIESGDDEPNAPREGRVFVFDLRSDEAFAAGHLPGARHVPPSEALRWIPQRALTQEFIALVDDAGTQDGPARRAAHALAHKWFRRIRYLAGGVAAWRAEGLDLEEGGPSGTGANSFDGTQVEFKRSAKVPWRVSQAPGTPDPTRAD